MIRALFTLLLLTGIIGNNAVSAVPPPTSDAASPVPPPDTPGFAAIGAEIERKLKKMGRAYGIRSTYKERPAFYKCVNEEWRYKRELWVLGVVAGKPDASTHGKQYIVKKRADYIYNGRYCIIYEDVGDVSITFLHSAGIAHCDIKQNNIHVVSHPTTKFAVRIFDFDLANPIDRKGPVPGALEDLRPPEYSLSQANSMAHYDAWGIGVLFFKLLIGQPNNYNYFITPYMKSYEYISGVLRKHVPMRMGSFTMFMPEKSNAGFIGRVG
ncbi:hypothetical protein SYNPS1DRAFT_23091, partial [Syncephalis pseudoplumigaleata]